MTTQENKINKIVKELNTENLIIKLIETLGVMKLAKINVAIQEELENRIGEDELDMILDANRQNV